MPNWTAEDFKRNLGMEPEADDLDRINCEHAGDFGHRGCGLCSHDRPKFWPCADCQASALDGHRPADKSIIKPTMRMRVVESTKRPEKLSLRSLNERGEPEALFKRQSLSDAGFVAGDDVMLVKV